MLGFTGRRLLDPYLQSIIFLSQNLEYGIRISLSFLISELYAATSITQNALYVLVRHIKLPIIL